MRNVQDGFVDYDGFRADPGFSRFITWLGVKTDGPPVSREGDLAFLINAYNALAIQGILDGYSPASLLGRYGFLNAGNTPCKGPAPRWKRWNGTGFCLWVIPGCTLLWCVRRSPALA